MSNATRRNSSQRRRRWRRRPTTMFYIMKQMKRRNWKLLWCTHTQARARACGNNEYDTRAAMQYLICEMQMCICMSARVSIPMSMSVCSSVTATICTCIHINTISISIYIVVFRDFIFFGKMHRSRTRSTGGDDGDDDNTKGFHRITYIELLHIFLFDSLCRVYVLTKATVEHTENILHSLYVRATDLTLYISHSLFTETHFTFVATTTATATLYINETRRRHNKH